MRLRTTLPSRELCSQRQAGVILWAGVQSEDFMDTVGRAKKINVNI